MTVQVEQAQRADLVRILEIRHDGFSAHAPRSYTAQEVQTLLDDVDPAELLAMIERDQLFVVRLQGRVVGCAGWKDANLRHVYVDPAQARQGIGTALVQHVEAEFFRQTGLLRIKAGVGFQAENFYRALGYEVDQRATAFDGSGYFIMSHRLGNR
jgi:GNAT superfamily N-acetyltransferase